MWVKRLSIAIVLVAVAGLARPAQAAFHLWHVQEVYSNASGSVQFIELKDPAGGQNFIGNQSISVSNVGNTQNHLFSIPGAAVLPETFNHTLLFGTSGLQAAGGPAPDFTLPDNFLFTAGGSISFFGDNSGAYPALPTDGKLSLAFDAKTTAVNSPTNFAGATGSVPEPGTAALLVSGAFAVLATARGRRRRD